MKLSQFNGTSKTYPITPQGKQIITLYKKRIKDNELVEIGYQNSIGWVLHKPEPTPKFVADFLTQHGTYECMNVSSYYPGTCFRSGIEITITALPKELYINDNEVIGFIVDEGYVYYDNFEHPTTKKVYIL